jgi:hypothetical protein
LGGFHPFHHRPGRDRYQYSGDFQFTREQQERFFGMAPGALVGFGGPEPGGGITVGGGFKQTFTLDVPTVLVFRYWFVYTDDPGYYDLSYYVLDGTPVRLRMGEGQTSTSWETLSLNLAAGQHTLGFAATNGEDQVADPALYVDVANVPEPGSMLRIGLTCAALGWRRMALRRAARRPLPPAAPSASSTAPVPRTPPTSSSPAPASTPSTSPPATRSTVAPSGKRTPSRGSP